MSMGQFISSIFCAHEIIMRWDLKVFGGTGAEVNPESWTQLKGSHEA